MKITRAISICCFVITSCFVLGGSEHPNPTIPLTEAEASEVRQKFYDYEIDLITLHELTGDEAQAKRIIAYYLTHSNAITTKLKLPVSRCFAKLSKYPEAAKLAEEYVTVYSNDWRGWSMLGGTKILMNSYEEGIRAYTNAVRLGDYSNLTGLGAAALQVGRTDVLTNWVVPRMLELKDSDQTSEEDRLEMILVLTVFSMQVKDESLFAKAIERVDAKKVASRDDLRKAITMACQQFDFEKAKRLLKNLKEAEQKSSIDTIESTPQITIEE